MKIILAFVSSLLLFTCSPDSSQKSNHSTDKTAQSPTKNTRPKEPTKEETKRDSVIILKLFTSIVDKSRQALKSQNYAEIAPMFANIKLNAACDINKDIDQKTVTHFCEQIAEAIPDNCPIEIHHVVTGYVPEGSYASFQITCNQKEIPCGFLKIDGKFLYAGLSNE